MLRQLVQALPPVYIKGFRNRHSMVITQPILTLLTTLFTTYGDVQDGELTDAIDKLKSTVFDVSEPLVGLHDDIEDLKELSIAAENELTERQLVALGLLLIKNANDFERGLETWVNQPVVTRTWLNFKAHFVNAQTQLRRLRGPNMKNTFFLILRMRSRPMLSTESVRNFLWRETKFFPGFKTVNLLF